MCWPPKLFAIAPLPLPLPLGHEQTPLLLEKGCLGCSIFVSLTSLTSAISGCWLMMHINHKWLSITSQDMWGVDASFSLNCSSYFRQPKPGEVVSAAWRIVVMYAIMGGVFSILRCIMTATYFRKAFVQSLIVLTFLLVSFFMNTPSTISILTLFSSPWTFGMNAPKST